MVSPVAHKSGFRGTLNLESDPVYELVVKEGLPKCASLFVNFEQNPWFPEVLRLEEQHMLAHDPIRHAHVWGGMPLPAVAGAIYFEEIMQMDRQGRLRMMTVDPLLQNYAVFRLGLQRCRHHGIGAAHAR
jgi:phage terminase large subunit